MAKTEIAVPSGANLKVAHSADTQMGRFKAFSHALEAVDDPRCQRPIPRFMVDMPWASADDDVAERIIAKMLSADNPYEVTNAGETLSGLGLVGVPVTVHDIRCAPSAKPGGWGAYLICDVTVGLPPARANNETPVEYAARVETWHAEAPHEIMTIGAKEPVAILAYAYFQGDLPLSGVPTVVTETGNGNTVLGFIVERPF